MTEPDRTPATTCDEEMIARRDTGANWRVCLYGTGVVQAGTGQGQARTVQRDARNATGNSAELQPQYVPFVEWLFDPQDEVRMIG